MGHKFYHLNQAVQDLAAQVVRASSVIENINSRLRNYFFLRRQLGPDYLVLLRFFLNHRRFLRSAHAKRVLGYKLFSKKLNSPVEDFPTLPGAVALRVRNVT